MITRFLFVLSTLFPLIAQGVKINGSEAVSIGGIKQWITFQGEDDQATVLLFLHGGPGNSVMGYAGRFTKELQKHFIVVMWDQRESGQTLSLNKSREPLTVSLFIRDAIEVIGYLCTRFSRDKICLMGHSWGGYLGLRIAAERPDLLLAYYAISPMIHQEESESISLREMKEKALNEHNSEALQELTKVEIPFKNGEQLYYHRKWLSKWMNSTMPTRSRVDQWSGKWLPLFNEASKTDFFQFAPAFNCPVYFLIGSKDYQTHYSLAESYYLKVVCKEKKLYWFTDSAHNPHLTESDKFQKIVIENKNQN